MKTGPCESVARVMRSTEEVCVSEPSISHTALHGVGGAQGIAFQQDNNEETVLERIVLFGTRVHL
jgi:hypothetical protein